MKRTELRRDVRAQLNWGIVVGVILLLAWLLRNCGQERPMQSAMRAVPGPARNSSVVSPSGREARLSDTASLEGIVLPQLQTQHAVMEECVEAVGDPQLAYDLRVVWDTEGRFVDLFASAPAPLLACWRKALKEVSIPMDSGLREREFQFELRVR